MNHVKLAVQRFKLSNWRLNSENYQSHTVTNIKTYIHSWKTVRQLKPPTLRLNLVAIFLVILNTDNSLQAFKKNAYCQSNPMFLLTEVWISIYFEFDVYFKNDVSHLFGVYGTSQKWYGEAPLWHKTYYSNCAVVVYPDLCMEGILGIWSFTNFNWIPLIHLLCLLDLTTEDTNSMTQSTS